MYIKLTSRCNMECSHCCYSCTAEGEDMSMETYLAILAWCEDHGQNYITLGGGEPTLHPQFKLMLIEAMAIGDGDDGCVHIITNGKLTSEAILLAKLAKSGVISAELSLDDYHEEIDESVVHAFARQTRGRVVSISPTVGVRDTSNGGRFDPLPHGRGADMSSIEPHERTSSDCPCSTLVFQPNGDIYLCGCDDAPKIGNIHEGFEFPEYWEGDTCCRDVAVNRLGGVGIEV